jgi:hypothetical protein
MLLLHKETFGTIFNHEVKRLNAINQSDFQIFCPYPQMRVFTASLDAAKVSINPKTKF